jgi:putative SOS response-associated peptidase YedK
MLRPLPAEGLAMHPVSPAVNNVHTQGPELLVPIGPAVSWV